MAKDLSKLFFKRLSKLMEEIATQQSRLGQG